MFQNLKYIRDDKNVTVMKTHVVLTKTNNIKRWYIIYVDMRGYRNIYWENSIKLLLLFVNFI